MQPRRIAILRLVRTLAAPVLLAIPPLFWVADATRRASYTTLGRDQGIFQYIAWAIARGERDYGDIRDVNGPLTHLVHRLFLALGGADEHRFRVLDLLVTGATFAAVGLCLPGWRGRRRVELPERVAWALAAWVVLSGQYLLYGYWDLAQRESFFDWFMLPSVALQLVASRSRRPGRWLVAVGALSAVPWLGKPTYALFTAAQVLGLLADTGMCMTRRKALRWFGVGFGAGLVPVGLWLLLRADVGAYLHNQFTDVPAMYRFIWPRSVADILTNPWNASQAIFGVIGAIVLLALAALGEMPARVVPVALLPLAALGSIVAQAKGFPYHFHPLTAAVHLQWLVFAAWLAERTRTARRDRALLRLVPLAVCVVFALRVATSMEDSPHIRATWLLWSPPTAEDREKADYFSHFPEPDFFPYELRQTAAYLRAHTRDDDRVQVYGMDPYLLFLAGRLSATPYLYAYDLDADAALGGWTGAVPDEAQRARIRAIRDAHEADLVRRLDARPPAAFVFLDASPLMTAKDAREDFQRHCPEAWDWFADRYVESARFGHNHVWFRKDVAPPAEPGEPGEDPSETP
ncbi:MAG TPA: hypothetical protein VF765_10260 [Polyangiaceae bacterium]